MIVTVTLNPAIDQTIEIDALVEGDTNRVASNRWDVGGKGINVARVLKELGYEPLACGFAPGDMGRMIEDSLLDAGIGCEFMFVPGETRTNITILDRTSHVHTVLAAPGPRVTEHAISQLRSRIARQAAAAHRELAGAGRVDSRPAPTPDCTSTCSVLRSTGKRRLPWTPTARS